MFGDSARTFGKSDPIDALAIARAALREPDLPVARLDGADREIRLLVDHREDLVAERTRAHQPAPLAPARTRSCMGPGPGQLRPGQRVRTHRIHLDGFSGIVADLAQRLLTDLHRLTDEIDELTAESAAGSQSSPRHCWRSSAAGP